MIRVRMVLVVAALLAAGCGASRDQPAGEATPTPTRIVSMAPALTEILFALGVGDRVVGVTDYCDYPPEARERAKIGGFVNPSVEAVLALEPDLVVVSPAADNRDPALALRRAGVRLEVVPGETLEDTYRAIHTLAGLCGVEARGEDLVRSIRSRIERVSSSVAGLPQTRALFCVQVEPLIAAGRGTLPSELMVLAGGLNIVEAERYPRIGIETVLAQAPEVVLQARMDVRDRDADRTLREYWGRWPSLPAVAARRVLVFDATTCLRAGPRVADAVEFLAAALHPGSKAGAATSAGKRP